MENVKILDIVSCRKTCLVGLLIRSILRGKIARALQCKIERINRPTRHVLLESRT